MSDVRVMKLEGWQRETFEAIVDYCRKVTHGLTYNPFSSDGTGRNLSIIAVWEYLLATEADFTSATATITEQTHRADAAEGEAAVWREKYEALELDHAMEIGSAADLDRDLATERAARLAAEGREKSWREIAERRRYGPTEAT